MKENLILSEDKIKSIEEKLKIDIIECFHNFDIKVKNEDISHNRDIKKDQILFFVTHDSNKLLDLKIYLQELSDLADM
ncbi:hypothetical protein, partial [Campylobacter volucris]|uniref:hypothetical protein n=1 Tax=Campylobacter volucris TaxID=1031542 RepID=UPI0018A0665B